MKNAVYVAVLVILALGAGMGLRGQADRERTVGRYSLFTAAHQSSDGGGNATGITDLFRIDTATGRTWQYFDAAKREGPGITMAWLPISEPRQSLK
jgi:hypothetical protein